MTFKQILPAIFITSGLLFTNYTDAQTVTTIAGNGMQGYGGDGSQATAASVKLNGPNQLAKDAAGNIYFSDEENSVIRKVSTSGVISTVAGNGTAGYMGDNGPATAAELANPDGIAVDASGNIYISDWYNNVIRKVSAAGIITTIAGTGTSGFSGDAGPATAAQIYGPGHMAFDHSGNLCFAEYYNNCIRKINASGMISTIAGVGGVGGYIMDGGPATNAHLSAPEGIAFDAAGNMFIIDSHNNLVRKVNTSGMISTVAGDSTVGWGYGGDGGPALHAQFHWPSDIALDATGNIYVADYTNLVIRRINTAGVVSTIVGTGGWVYNGEGHTGTTANIGNPTGVLVSGSTLYFSDPQNSRVRKIGVSTVAVPEIGAENGAALVYPNPNNGAFTLSGKATTTEGHVKMTLEDIGGRVLMTNNIPVEKGLFRTEINVENLLTPGTYLVEISSATDHSVVKFVKE